MTERLLGSALDPKRAKEDGILARAMQMLSKVHRWEPQREGSQIDLLSKARGRLNELRIAGVDSSLSIDELEERAVTLQNWLTNHPVPQTFCHGDFWHGNLLLDPKEDRLWLLDWEEADWGDPFVEIARYLTLIDFPIERADLPLEMYLGRTPALAELKRLYVAMALLNIDFYGLAGCREGVATNKPNFAAMAKRIESDAHVLGDMPGVRRVQKRSEVLPTATHTPTAVGAWTPDEQRRATARAHQAARALGAHSVRPTEPTSKRAAYFAADARRRRPSSKNCSSK